MPSKRATKSEVRPVKPGPWRTIAFMEKVKQSQEITAQKMDPYAPKPALGRPLMSSERRIPGSVSLPGSYWDRLKRLSATTKRPMAQLVEDALKAYFLEAEK